MYMKHFSSEASVRRRPAVEAFLPAHRRRRRWRPADFDQHAVVPRGSCGCRGHVGCELRARRLHQDRHRPAR